MADQEDIVVGKEEDFLKADISCLNPKNLRATLISTAGSYCEVWRSSRRITDEADNPAYFEFVIKFPRGVHSSAEIKILSNHHRMLKAALDDVIPPAVFFITQVNGQSNVCVVSEAVNIWFDMANPQNREEALELLKNNPKPRNQLRRFVDQAKAWRVSDNPRLIDLFGVNNLVMDTNREIKYLDSFFVFFFEDMLDLLQEKDEDLEYCIGCTLDRLKYLEQLLVEVD